MTTEMQKSKGVQSTRETWSLAIKYVAERKRIEEALGFILKLGDVVARGSELDGTFAALRKTAVPYLADIVYFDLVGSTLAPDVEVNTAARLAPATVARLRQISSSVLSGAPGAEPESKNSVSLHAEPGETAVKSEGAFIRVPLHFRGQTFGSLTFVKCTDDVPKYSKAHVVMAAEYARNLASAIYMDGSGSMAPRP